MPQRAVRRRPRLLLPDPDPQRRRAHDVVFQVHQVREAVERVRIWRGDTRCSAQEVLMEFCGVIGFFLHGDGETGIGRSFEDSHVLIQGTALDDTTFFCGAAIDAQFRGQTGNENLNLMHQRGLDCRDDRFMRTTLVRRSLRARSPRSVRSKVIAPRCQKRSSG